MEFAWNGYPIDRISILRSAPAIGQELGFPLEINLSALPIIISNNADSVVSHLRLIDFNRYFASTILKILVDDRRTVHAKRINNYRNIVTIHPGDLVIVRTAVQIGKTRSS